MPEPEEFDVIILGAGINGKLMGGSKGRIASSTVLRIWRRLGGGST